MFLSKMNPYHLSTFIVIFLLISNTVLSYPSYSNRSYRQKYRLLGMIMPELPSLIRDDLIWKGKLLSIYGKKFDLNANIFQLKKCSMKMICFFLLERAPPHRWDNNERRLSPFEKIDY